MTIPILIIFKRLHLLKNGFYIMLNTIPLYKFCSRTLNYFIRIYKKFTLESILISIFALFMINNISLFKIPLYQEGDIAANALLILRAKKLELLHGNYSRFGFYHPGPFFYYVYALGEIILFDYLHLVPEPLNAHIISAFFLQLLFLYFSVE